MSARGTLGSVAVVAITVWATGCLLLPIAHTDVLAPTIVGRVVQGDGRPASAIPVSISTTDHC